MTTPVQPATTDRGEPLRLSPAADIDAIDATRRRVLDYLAPHALGERTLYAVELVLEEALTNVIKYAASGRQPRGLGLTVAVDGNEVVLVVEDDGDAFDPLQVPERVPPSSIEEACPGGLGIPLMRRFCSSMSYRRADGRNRLTLAIDRRHDAGQAHTA